MIKAMCVDGRLTARYREVSKPRDSGLGFCNRSEIWQSQFLRLRDFTKFGDKMSYRLVNRGSDTGLALDVAECGHHDLQVYSPSHVRLDAITLTYANLLKLKFVK